MEKEWDRMYFEIIVSFHQVYQEELGLKKLSISAFSTQSSTEYIKMPKTLMMSQAFYLFVQEVTYIFLFI